MAFKKDAILNEKGQEICGAKRKQGRGVCQSIILIGETGRCRMHGGMTLVGIAAPNFITGRYSKHLPTRLYERFAESQADPMLFELRSEVSLVDTRISELLQRIENKGDSTELWKRVEADYQKLHESIMGASEPQEVLFKLGELGKTVRDGTGDWATWSEIARMVEQRRRLVESERMHQKQMQQLVSIDQMMLLAGALLASVKTHVKDRSAIAAISRDIDVHFRRQ